MKKRFLLAALLAVAGLTLSACGSSSSSSSDPALTYATYGQALNAVVPAGLKAGGANASASPLPGLSAKELSGVCATSYTDCPYLTAAGGGDSNTGEILMRLWGLDYDGECTESLITSGTCFHCEDCGATASGNFIIPTMFSAPTTCGTISTTEGRYVNLDVDPCFFDSMIADISNIDECKTVAGGAVDLSSAIPWYASWGIPQEVSFSSYSSRSSGGVWWTINNGSSGADQYFLSLDPNWLYAGIKKPSDNLFLFLGTGSPAYYSGRGEGSGINISAYAGPVDTITSTFEVIQVRDQGSDQYIERLRSNGSYLWYQKYSGSSFPATPSDVAAVKDNPTDNRCVQIGSSVVASRYVPLQSCVDSFSAASVTALNQDSNYTLKIIDAETAGAISFSTSLTPTVTTSSCLESQAQ